MASTSSSYFKSLFDPDNSLYDTLVTSADIARDRRAAVNYDDISQSILDPLKNELLGRAATYAALVGRTDLYKPTPYKKYTA